MLNTYEEKSRQKLVATVLMVLVIAGIVLLADHVRSDRSDDVVPAQHTTTTAISSTPSASSAAAPAGYKDGSYTASATYLVPHGQENIQVTVTLQNGTVTDASIKNSENDFTSASFQESFASTYKSMVVGKKISDLQLSVVAGASDTTQAFNDAVSKIASNAHA